MTISQIKNECWGITCWLSAVQKLVLSLRRETGRRLQKQRGWSCLFPIISIRFKRHWTFEVSRWGSASQEHCAAQRDRPPLIGPDGTLAWLAIFHGQETAVLRNICWKQTPTAACHQSSWEWEFKNLSWLKFRKFSVNFKVTFGEIYNDHKGIMSWVTTMLFSKSKTNTARSWVVEAQLLAKNFWLKRKNRWNVRDDMPTGACPPSAHFFGHLGAALALGLASTFSSQFNFLPIYFVDVGSAYGTAKAGVALAHLGIQAPAKVMRGLGVFQTYSTPLLWFDLFHFFQSPWSWLVSLASTVWLWRSSLSVGLQRRCFELLNFCLSPLLS